MTDYAIPNFMNTLNFTRVALKLSGEAMLGPTNTFPYNPETMLEFAREISDAHDLGVEIAVVVGGGNIFRGANGASHGMNRSSADNFGMLATIQNGIVLQDLLERQCGKDTRLMSGLEVNKVAEPYIPRRAVRHLEKKRIIILAGGTGNPYCTTDYAVALRANEIGAQLIVKATNVDGVYDSDPNKNADAKLLPHVSYEKMPIRVFSLKKPGNVVDALSGKDIGSLVSDIDDRSSY